MALLLVLWPPSRSQTPGRPGGPPSPRPFSHPGPRFQSCARVPRWWGQSSTRHSWLFPPTQASPRELTFSGNEMKLCPEGAGGAGRGPFLSAAVSPSGEPSLGAASTSSASDAPARPAMPLQSRWPDSAARSGPRPVSSYFFPSHREGLGGASPPGQPGVRVSRTRRAVAPIQSALTPGLRPPSGVAVWWPMSRTGIRPWERGLPGFWAGVRPAC